jgi:hypothetical protein
MERIDGYVWAFHSINKVGIKESISEQQVDKCWCLSRCVDYRAGASEKMFEITQGQCWGWRFCDAVDFVMQLINNLSMEYDSLVEAVEENMNKELEDQVTVKRVWEKIRARFRKMTMRLSEGISNNNRNEVALVIPPRQFNSMCYLCRK